MGRRPYFEKILKLKNKLSRNKQESVLIYNKSGDIGSDILLSIVSELEGRFRNEGVERSLFRKVLKVSIELLQNIQCHKSCVSLKCDDKNYTNSFFDFSVFKISKGVYELAVGNYVDTKQGIALKETIEQVNFINPSQIRELYRTILKKGHKEGRERTNLGLISVYKISGNKLKCEIKDVCDDVKFYTIKVLI